MSVYSENLIREVISYVANNGRIKVYNRTRIDEPRPAMLHSYYEASDANVTLVSALGLEIRDEVTKTTDGAYFDPQDIYEANRSVSVSVVFTVDEPAVRAGAGVPARRARTVQKRGTATVQMSFAEIVSEIAGPVEVTF